MKKLKKKLKKDLRKKAKQATKEKKRKLSAAECAQLLLKTLRDNRERYVDGIFFGLYWDESISDFRHRKNKRRVNLVDAEHMLCKAYICYIQTTASRYVSVFPDFFKPFCHPSSARQPLWQLTDWRSKLKRDGYEELLTRYKQMYEDGTLPFCCPDFSLYDNELEC
jgi:hypothetical protein